MQGEKTIIHQKGKAVKMKDKKKKKYIGRIRVKEKADTGQRVF